MQNSTTVTSHTKHVTVDLVTSSPSISHCPALKEITALLTSEGKAAPLRFVINKAKTDFKMKNKNSRRAQRDWVLRQRRGIIEEQLPMFALGQKDSQPPDMENDSSEIMSKRQDHEILTEKRNMENLMSAHSADSTAKLQKAIHIAMKKIGELAPKIRRVEKDAILKKLRNIISTELELEEALQETPTHVPFSGSESEETSNLQREAAQIRMKNSRDWVVQRRRRLHYARPIVNGNGALKMSQSSATNISFIESKTSNCSDSTPKRSLEEDVPADEILNLPSEKAVIPVEDRGNASSQTSPPSEPVNTRTSIDLDNLTFYQKLGSGTFGKVVLASDPVSEELLAVKIMSKSRTGNKIFTELDVLTIAAGSPFLISMRAFTEKKHHYVIAMDYMARGDLHHLMMEWMPFDYQTTRPFAAEMVCGLQFLHDHGVVHRDLKPQNILLDGIGHIKIADFGLAAINVFGEDTMNGFLGTKGYTAPEVMNGESYTHLVDSFSFGVILYMMSIGDQPFYGEGTKEDYYISLQEDEPFYLEEMCPHTINIIDGLLCKAPCGRLPITSSIRSHPFFFSIDWDDVESGSSCPPFQWDFE